MAQAQFDARINLDVPSQAAPSMSGQFAGEGASNTQIGHSDLSEQSQDEDGQQDGRSDRQLLFPPPISNPTSGISSPPISASSMPPPAVPGPSAPSKKRKAVVLGEDGLPVPKPAAKRKKKDPAQPGPGKNWRRGVKGAPKPIELDAEGRPIEPFEDVSGGLTVKSESASVPEKEKKPKAPRKPRVSKATTGEKGASKAASQATTADNGDSQNAISFTGSRGITGFLPIRPLLAKTPKPRHWDRKPVTFATIGGPSFTYVSYKADTFSPLAQTLAALEQAKAAATPRDSSATPEPSLVVAPAKVAKRKKTATPHPLAQQIQLPQPTDVQTSTQIIDGNFANIGSVQV